PSLRGLNGTGSMMHNAPPATRIVHGSEFRWHRSSFHGNDFTDSRIAVPAFGQSGTWNARRIPDHTQEVVRMGRRPSHGAAAPQRYRWISRLGLRTSCRAGRDQSRTYGEQGS